jgi:ribokinase
VVTTPTLPTPGETVLGEGFSTVPGGKGANQAVAAARAGADCAFVGAVGQDSFGGLLRDNLVGAGVDVSRLRAVPGPSGVALIAVDSSAENFIVVAPGANGELVGLDAEDRALIAAADVLLLQLETPLTAVAEAAGAARAGGTTVVLNAAPARSLPAELLALVDVLVVNQGEAETIVGRADEPDALLAALLDLVPRVVLTLGARGARYADRAGLRLAVDAPLIEAVDTTASGDSFTGALAVAWAELGAAGAAGSAGAAVAAASDPVVAALRWACAAGAACARRPGASTAIPTRDEIDELSATTYGAAR